MPNDRRVLALLLVAVVIGILPAASATPIDPTWIGGFWDDDDFDNVVVFIGSTSAISAPSAVEPGPVWVLVAHVEAADPDTPPAQVHTAAHPRAPPVASSFSS